MGELLDELLRDSQTEYCQRSLDINICLMRYAAFCGTKITWNDIANDTGLSLKDVMLVLGGEPTSLNKYDIIENYVSSALSKLEEKKKLRKSSYEIIDIKREILPTENQWDFNSQGYVNEHTQTYTNRPFCKNIKSNYNIGKVSASMFFKFNNNFFYRENNEEFVLEYAEV